MSDAAGRPKSQVQLIYYAVTWPSDQHLADELAVRLARSVVSLRTLNENITVALVQFGPGSPKGFELFLDQKGVQILRPGPFEECVASLHPTGSNYLARYPIPKWVALAVLDPNPFSQILYCDCDTYFFRNPALLFENYRSRGLYAREQPVSSIIGPAEQEGLGEFRPMNTGMMMLNGDAPRDIRKRVPLMLSFILRFMAWMVDDPSDGDLDSVQEWRRDRRRGGATPVVQPLRYPSSNRWIVEEFAAFLALSGLADLTVGLFKPKHVMQGAEFLARIQLTEEIAAHYYTVNSEAFREWLVSQSPSGGNPGRSFDG